MEHLVLLASVSFLPCALRKLPEAVGLKATKSCYPHYFNIEVNLDYVDPMSDISYYRVDEMIGGERKDFLAWYERQKSEPFDNKRELVSYFQNGVTFPRQTCLVFRRAFLLIGKIKVLLESLSLASACNKMLRPKFL